MNQHFIFMNATVNMAESVNPNGNGIQKLCRTMKIMFWLYLGCLVLVWRNGFLFFQHTPDGWRAFHQTYREISEVPWYSLGLVAVAAGFLVWAAVTFYQLLSLYERGAIFSVDNVRLLRRLGWLAAGFGLLKIIGPTVIDLWRQWLESLPRGVFLDRALHDLVAVFFALLSSPWIMGGLFLLTISRVMLQGYKLQEEHELTV